MPTRSLLRWLIPAAMALGLAFPASVFADAPTADAVSQTTLEDQAVDITLSGRDTEGDALTFTIVTGPTNGSLGTIGTPNCTGIPSVCTAVVTYTPNANVSGSDSFTYKTTDASTVDSAPATVSITITFVNDAPSFAKGADQTVAENSSAALLTGWATAISTGPGTNESGQTVSFNVAATDTALFSVQPAVASNGDLTFTPATNIYGTTIVTISITDSGGTANGGVDTSANQTFNINVHGPPTAHNDTATIAENAPATAINVIANDTYLPNPPETLVISAVTQGSHGAVAITGGGTGLTYKPNSGYVGTDLFTYTIKDPVGLTASASVLVTVSSDTTPPVVTAPNESILKGVTLGTSTLLGRVTWSGSDAGVGLSQFTVQRSVNGGTYTTLTLSSAKATSITVGLAFGTYYQFRVRATDLNGNVSGWVYGPKFRPLLYQESSTFVIYNAAWSIWSNSNNSGGSTRFTSTASRSATFSQFGRDYSFIAPKGSGRGWARIYLDGVLQTTVSLWSSSTFYRQVLWSAHYGSDASHTIRIVVYGNGRVDVDCFAIFR